jgi:hypothetical protein
LALFQPSRGVGGPADAARIAPFRVPDLSGFVDFFAGYADFRSGRLEVTVCNFFAAMIAPLLNLAARLRGVLLISQPALCLRFDIQRVGLSPWRSLRISLTSGRDKPKAQAIPRPRHTRIRSFRLFPFRRKRGLDRRSLSTWRLPSKPPSTGANPAVGKQMILAMGTSANSRGTQFVQDIGN